MGYSPWGHKELDTPERLHFTSLYPGPKATGQLNRGGSPQVRTPQRRRLPPLKMYMWSSSHLAREAVSKSPIKSGSLTAWPPPFSCLPAPGTRTDGCPRPRHIQPAIPQAPCTPIPQVLYSGSPLLQDTLLPGPATDLWCLLRTPHKLRPPAPTPSSNGVPAPVFIPSLSRPKPRKTGTLLLPAS